MNINEDKKQDTIRGTKANDTHKSKRGMAQQNIWRCNVIFILS
jgi:hypothetical protein